jgi:hypothetical protein
MPEEMSEVEEKTEDQDLKDLHAKSLRSFNLSWSKSWEDREQSLEDRRFCMLAGAQFEGDLKKLFENKPKIEINKGLSSVIRIINEYRSNRITVDYISADGVDRDELADTCDRLYRADEMKSSGQEAYDNAFEEAVTGGMGAWRYRADYEDEYDIDNEYQKICIEPITDAASCVFFNADAVMQDKSDATECWVLTAYTTDYYEEEFGDSPVTFPHEVEDNEFDWCQNDKVYVAEYYKVEEIKEKVRIYKNENGEKRVFTLKEIKEDPGIVDDAIYDGYFLDKERTMKRKQIHKYLMNGAEIIEDQGIIAGTEIPIVVVYGKRSVIDGIERFMGHIRMYKDPQRVLNAMFSKLLEIAGISAARIPIVLDEQIGPFWQEWADQNIKNYPALRLKSIKDKDGNVQSLGQIYYKEPPNIPEALAALMELANRFMQDILGNDQEAQKVVSNVSGEVIEQIQDRLGIQSFIYTSNFAKGIRRGGQIWLSMAKDLYVEKGRKMMALNKEYSVDYVELMKPYKNPESGEIYYKNDFSNALFEIMVDIGPSHASKRKKIVRELTEVLQFTTNPDTKSIIEAMILMNMEGEGLQDIRKYYRKKLIKLGVEEPNEEEMKDLQEELQNTPPNANEEYLKSAAQNEQAKAVKAQADTRKTLADTEKIIAETAETFSKIDREDQLAALEMAGKINESLDVGNQPATQQNTVENSNIG